MLGEIHADAVPLLRGDLFPPVPERYDCAIMNPPYAHAGLRHRRSPARPKRHPGEVFIRIAKKTFCLWRAVGEDGILLDILVQERRNQEAAERFLRRVVEGAPGEPRVVVTDMLASYGPATRTVLPQSEHREHTGLNNRAENSHQPTRQRGRRMRRFKSPGHAQQFLEPFGPIYDRCCPRRRLLGAVAYRQELARDSRYRRLAAVAALARRCSRTCPSAPLPSLLTVTLTMPEVVPLGVQRKVL